MMGWNSDDDIFYGCFSKSFDRIRFNGTRRRVLHRYPFCSALVYEKDLDCGTEGTE